MNDALFGYDLCQSNHTHFVVIGASTFLEPNQNFGVEESSKGQTCAKETRRNWDAKKTDGCQIWDWEEDSCH